MAQRGGVFLERKEMDEDAGVKQTKQVLLCANTIFPVDILNNNGVHEVHFCVMRNKQLHEVLLPQKYVWPARTTRSNTCQARTSWLRSAQATTRTSTPTSAPALRSSARRKTRSRCRQATAGKTTTPLCLQAGCTAPTSRPSWLMPELQNIVANTKPKGTLENWRKVIDMMVRRKMWDQLAVVLAGAASPLMKFTGLFGMTVHVASSESGTGKSLSLDAAASIWGHPQHYRTGSGTSPVAMQQRLGHLRSLPMITDEITTNNRKDFEWFPAFLFSMSEGRGKERMEVGHQQRAPELVHMGVIHADVLQPPGC
jgi:hypothetical protein